MNRKFRTKPARCGGKRMKGISREVRVLDLQGAYGISMDAVGSADGFLYLRTTALAIGNKSHYIV